MNEKSVYWVWLQQALKYNNLKIKYIMNFYEDIEKFYALGENEWRLLGIFTNKDIENLKNLSMEKAKIILSNCKQIGCEIVTIEDKRFPYLLKQIEDPPAVLYVKGDISCMDGKLVVAVVGTRKASNYGFEMAEKISKSLAENDAVVVSGGALGIDSAAHEGAVAANGKTVCVLGCGLDFAYLASKNNMKYEIIKKGGAIITEYSPGTPARSWTFPARNRIISGLSHGVVVVEAGRKSGSLITANLANDQNRDVFVVDSPAKSEESSGNLSLINDGAQVIRSGDDILKEYSSRSLAGNESDFLCSAVSKKSYEFKKDNSDQNVCKEDTFQKKKEVAKIDFRIKDLNEDERKIYEAVSEGIIQSDGIVEKTGIPSYKVLGALTTLELWGLIKSLPGKYYEII